MVWVGFTDKLAKGNYNLHQFYYDMPITEYLNFLAYDIMKRKEREKVLDNAITASKSAKSNDIYQLTLLKEILNHL